MLERGKIVFAERCARCHSSKTPEPAAGLDPGGCAGPDYLAVLEPATGSGRRPTSSRRRCGRSCSRRTSSTATTCRPSSACRSRCCRPTPAARSRPTRSPATSGTTSRRRPTRTCRRSARSRCTIRSPASRRQYQMPAGGRGYTRPPSLISLWSTAPFLLNNTRRARSTRARRSRRGWRRSRTASSRCCGRRSGSKDPVLGDKVPGIIDRTTARSYLTDPGRLPARAAGQRCSSRSATRCATGRRARRHRARADPGGHAGQPARQPRPASRPDGLLDRVGHDAQARASC